jgi:hypothetical protein
LLDDRSERLDIDLAESEVHMSVKWSVLGMLLLTASIPTFANDAKLPCNYSSEAESKDYSSVAAEFTGALANNDAEKAARFMKFPIKAKVDGKTTSIKNPDELKKNFSKIFNKEFVSKIVNNKPEDTVCNWQGAGIANGSIWINDVSGNTGDRSVKVITINN